MDEITWVFELGFGGQGGAQACRSGFPGAAMRRVAGEARPPSGSLPASLCSPCQGKLSELVKIFFKFFHLPNLTVY